MIRSFRHRGLKLLYQSGDARKIHPEFVAKVERILARLDQASDVSDMNLPGFRLHPLTGDMSGLWAVTVSRNFRVVFRFRDGHATEVDLVDYH
jgi:toxin HigB-1